MKKSIKDFIVINTNDLTSNEAKNILEQIEHTKSMTLGEFYYRHYIPYIKTTKKSYRQDMNFFKNHILPQWKNIPMNQLSREQIAQKHASLIQKNNLSPNTANKLIKYLSHAFNLAIDWEIEAITQNPTSRIKLFPITNFIERYLTHDEAINLLNAASKDKNPYIKLIIEFLLLTGARKTEVLTAQWKYIDLENKLWTIPYTKSGKIRRVPIIPKLEEVISQIPKKSNIYLFPSINDTNKPIKTFEHHWYKARKIAELEDVRIHDLRHTFASVLINNGRSLYEVQILLGHSNITVTQRYAHLTQKSLQEAASSAEKIVD